MTNSEMRALVITLSLDDLRCLAAAEGYIELGMFEEALAELQRASARCHKIPLVQTLELCVCAGLTDRTTRKCISDLIE
jgi:hypothetical protein